MFAIHIDAALRRVSVRAVLLLLTHCAAPTAPAPTRTSQPADARENGVLLPGAGSAHAGSNATVMPNPGLLPKPSTGTAIASDAGALDGCMAGTYSGTYDIGLLGAGPLQFELVAGQAASQSGPACQEFCPQLMINTDGGRFSGSWLGIEAVAKVMGGLDCRTGEFRADLVDGHYGMGTSDGGLGELIPPGPINGSFRGQLKGGAVLSIEGPFTVTTTLESQGTFSVQRQP